MNMLVENLPTFSLPFRAPRLAQEHPREEPQSLVMAFELGQLFSRCRERWPALDLKLPRNGTWPLLSWPQALRDALDRLVDGAASADARSHLALDVREQAGRLRVDVEGDAEQARQWLPQALLAAQRLAAWQGGRLLWRVSGARWRVRLSLPLSPSSR
ncbi:MAG: hypothetical protein GAK43_01268 [Stenotrophomonas maltophilia]|nr:MAG: hypothetical protein GAK43_01268 [Stenotrophomonas maltophilia]